MTESTKKKTGRTSLRGNLILSWLEYRKNPTYANLYSVSKITELFVQDAEWN
jgi:hypothetical protein